jgi:RNA polymerase sigma factor for flagellar operon FliA
MSEVMSPPASRPASPVSPAPGNKAPADPLWAAYWYGGQTPAARNALMEHYLPLVRFAAQRLASRGGRRAQPTDVDDLLQYGVFGLKDAIRGFDPARGVKFETYCLQRVRGAMLDGLKTHHWAPRELRQRLTRYAAAHERTQAEAGPGPHFDAIAACLGVCADAVQELEGHAARMVVGSMHLTDAAAADDGPGDDCVPDHREEEPSVVLQRQDVRDLFFRELTRAERHLLMLYYYEELTMREIGGVLGISGTRVSQLHTEIVGRLRAKLAPRVTGPAGQSRPALEI